VTTTGAATMWYTNGIGSNEFFSNSDMEITLGAGGGYPFSVTFSPRVWN
jgi:hypothetical protein